MADEKKPQTPADPEPAKSWLDEKMDAAKEAAAAAQQKAALEAGKAVVAGVVGAAGSQLDSWLSAMEGELARRQAEAAPRAAPDPADAPARGPEAGRSTEDRQQVAAAELVRMKAQARRAPRVDFVDDPLPAAVDEEELPEVEAEIEDLPEVDAVEPLDDPPPEGVTVPLHVEPWVRPDPMAAAQAALDKARSVRRDAGLPEPEPPVRATVSDPRDPFAAAQAALERAKEARASVGRSPAAMVREERARQELEQLKGRRGAGPDPDPPPDEGPKAPPPASKRRL